MLEDEHKVLRLKRWLPAGPLEDGGRRERDLVQFIAENGGTRTVAVEDLILL